MNETKSSVEILGILAKVAKVLSKIIWVCCIVGLILCVLSILALSLFGENARAYVTDASGMEIPDLCASIGLAALFAVGELVITAYACTYFDEALKRKEPFTKDFAILTGKFAVRLLLVPIITDIVVLIAKAILKACGLVPEIEAGLGGSVWIGIMFLVLGIVFRCGADRLENN